MPSSKKEDLKHLLSSQTKEDVLFAKHQRADEGGAEEVRMMIMGPAQDNLTVHKLLSDTGACDSACGGIVWFFTVTKTWPGVWQLSMMRGGWTSGADNLPITREPSRSRLRALA